MSVRSRGILPGTVMINSMSRKTRIQMLPNTVAIYTKTKAHREWNIPGPIEVMFVLAFSCKVLCLWIVNLSGSAMTLRDRSIQIPGIVAALVKAQLGVPTTRKFQFWRRRMCYVGMIPYFHRDCSDVQNVPLLQYFYPYRFSWLSKFPLIFIKFKIDRSTFERRVCPEIATTIPLL